MEGKDKIDLAIRAGMIAKTVLQLIPCKSKLRAKLVMAETVDLLMALEKIIKELPED